MTSSEEIWVIIGSTGEYSDREEHVAGFVRSEENSKEMVLLLTRENREMMSRWNSAQNTGDYFYWEEEQKLKKEVMNELIDLVYKKRHEEGDKLGCWPQECSYRYQLAMELKK